MSRETLDTYVFHDGFELNALFALLLVMLLMRAAKEERRSVLLFAGLFVAAVAGLFGGGLLHSAGEIGAAKFIRGFAIFLEGVCLISLLGTAIFRVALPAFRCASPRILQDVVVAVAFLIWMGVWLRNNGVDLTSIVATSAVLTAVIGFSLQDTLGNILGGMSIQIDRSVQVGDWIEVDGKTGRVAEVRWRHTSIETRTWETVVIPNSYLVKNRFVVLGRRTGKPTQWRRTVRFQVGFDYPPMQVLEVVQTALREAHLPRVASDPPPDCQFLEFSTSAGEYGARYWLTDLSCDEPTDTSVRTAVYYALRRAGIPVSIPSQSVYLTHEDEEHRALKQERALAQKVEALSRVDIFGNLHPDEIQTLAEGLVHTPFANGDVMTRQGSSSNWLYLIIDGRADVLVDNGGATTRVAELGAGSFFGEMGLMTGEPRSATVVARSEVDCYRLGKDAFEEILRSRPQIAEEVSAVLARRRLELDAVRENLDEEARAKRLSSARQDMLGKIRRFFSLDSGDQ